MSGIGKRSDMHIFLLLALVLSGLVWGLVNLQREMRRREWSKKNITPLYSIADPRELVATLALGLLKCGGEITAEQKSQLLRVYQEQLKFDEKRANEAFGYASYVLGTDPNYADRVRDIMAPALAKFNEEQRQSTKTILAELEPSPVQSQERFLDQVLQQFVTLH